ncbi:MAG: methyl-accepting chemotaxis protein [Gammaproteobacteria bacterium]|nr:methyl-accepting chemotaxis protein [Gammaproteobacteria bacterium]
MAKKTDNASTFKIVVGLAALLLIAAAALVYLQATGGGNSGAPELAALSQAIPSQASRALDGEEGAFDQLDASVRKIASLRRGVALGRSTDWQQLESQASAILAKRSEIEAMHASASSLAAEATAVLEGSNELLDLSGATAIIQEFQQRADRVRQTAATLPSAGESAANEVAEHVAFLRNVVDGLGGEATDLDIRPLNAEGREAALVPLLSSIATLEEQSAALGANIGQIATLGATQAQLSASSDKLLGSAFGASGGGGILPAALNIPWIPIGLVVLAIALLLGLQVLHNKSAIFERAAREQADQNERNQQAILRLLDEMGSLADGDLTVEATVTEDITGTIADSFNFAIEELRKLVATVNDTALLVDTATKQTENTASHLARAADNQAKEINAATESIVSMAASIEEVSGNAERSSDVARHSVEVAHKGGEAVRRTIDGMNAIRETIQETSKRIKRLGESSQEIGNIVELINDIAEQTNILALNASIQASMAGEAGRGFAVVADEVQRLAERSTNATKQIEVLVRTIQADTNEAVVSMERSTTDVVGGALLAENAGAALDEIEQVSNQIASLVQNISSSARQQAGSAADVTRRTTRLREIGDQTGKATSATAASISKLSELATQLRKTVEGFALPQDMMQTSALTRTPSQAPPPPAAPAKPQVKAG